jgi:O-antigen/teichoic acid export membrane protein
MSRLKAFLLRAIKMPVAITDGGRPGTIVGVISLGGAQLAATGLLALASLYLVRSLSTYEYGRTAFGLNINQLLLTFAGLGLGAGVLAEIAGVRRRGAAWTTVHALLGIRMLSVIPILMVGFAWGAATSDTLPALAAVAASLFLVQDFLAVMLAGDLRSRASALVIVCLPVCYAGLLVFLHVGSAEAVLVALSAALLVALLLAIALLQRGTRGWIGWPRGSLAHLRRAFRVARNAYLIVVLQIGSYVVPIILLGALGRFADAAALSIVLTLIRFVPEALSFAVLTTYFPRLSAIDPVDDEARALFGTFARLLGCLAIPAAAGLAVMAAPILALLFAGRYDFLAPYLTMGSLLVLALPIESLLTWTLVARGDGPFAVLGPGLRLVAVVIACLALVSTDALNPLPVVLIASAAGASLSIASQGLRIVHVRSLPWPAGTLTVYGLMVVVGYVALRAVSSGRASDIAMLVATGLLTVALLAVGAWLTGRERRDGTGGGGTP